MKTYLLIAAAVVIQPAVSVAHTSPAGAGFQQAQVLGSSDGIVVATGGRGGRGGVTIGRPYSATAVTHTVQMLADGSHIETTRSQVLYRDDQGRTRTELNDANPFRLLIVWRVSLSSLDTAAKTARAVEIIRVGRGVDFIATQPATTYGTMNRTSPQVTAANSRNAMVQMDTAGQGASKSNLASEDLGTQSFIFRGRPGAWRSDYQHPSPSASLVPADYTMLQTPKLN
jgi:hypothetical protein